MVTVIVNQVEARPFRNSVNVVQKYVGFCLNLLSKFSGQKTLLAMRMSCRFYFFTSHGLNCSSTEVIQKQYMFLNIL